MLRVTTPLQAAPLVVGVTCGDESLTSAVSFGLNDDQRAIDGESTNHSPRSCKLNFADLSRTFAREKIVPVAAELDRTMVSSLQKDLGLWADSTGVPVGDSEGSSRRRADEHPCSRGGKTPQRPILADALVRWCGLGNDGVRHCL